GHRLRHPFEGPRAHLPLFRTIGDGRENRPMHGPWTDDRQINGRTPRRAHLGRKLARARLRIPLHDPDRAAGHAPEDSSLSAARSLSWDLRGRLSEDRRLYRHLRLICSIPPTQKKAPGFRPRGLLAL